MGHPGVPTTTTGAAAHVRGRWLFLARAAWVAVLALTLGLFAAGLPTIVAQLQEPCAGAGCYRWQPTPQIAADLARRGLSLGDYTAYMVTLDGLFVLGFCAIAAVIVLRRPEEPMALFASFTLVTFGPAFSNTILALGLSAPLWWWPRTGLAYLGWSALFVFFYLFPDGRFVPRWTRWAAGAWVAFMALSYFSPPSWSINQGTSGAFGPSGGPLFGIGVLSSFASVVAAQIYRYRRVSTPAQGQQTKWVIYGFFAAFGGFVLNMSVVGQLIGSNTLFSMLVSPFVFCAVLLLLPLSIGVAILRYRLWDIDIIVNRTLVYGILTACVVTVYILVVGYLGAALRTGGSLFVSLLATGVVAVLFQPLRARLQRGVNRLMYGERNDPYGVLSRLGRRLEASLAPEAVLPAAVEDIAGALRLPHVAIWLTDGEALRLGAVHGRKPTITLIRDIGAVKALRRASEELEPDDLDPSGQYRTTLDACGVVLVLPLTHRGELVGALSMAPRGPGERLSAADRQLLRDLATQSGAAAHAVRLAVELRSSLKNLRRSRERLVAAQEEERRRIQRDLHDGLGPVLASMRLRLEACLDMAEGTEGPLSDGLQRLYDLVGEATEDIRRLVYDLRPPVLDQLGLLPAIRQHCERFGRESGIKFGFEADPDLSIPAAAEVTLLRIVQEALLNVHKHARASRVDVGLWHRDRWIELEIRDDGVGFEANGQGGGTGIGSMHERSELLGGTLHAAGHPGAGTKVTVRIPTGIPGEEVNR